jgi:NifU-like protein involved in Fe-S cluster formation
MYEAQLSQLTQQTFNMESAALATENLRNTMATVDAMKQTNKELRKQYGKIDVDKIEVRVQCFITRWEFTRRVLAEYALRHGRSTRTGERDTGDTWSFLCGAR